MKNLRANIDGMNNVLFMLTQSTSTPKTIPILSIQEANMLKISKDVLLITMDDLNKKAELTATNYPCWELTHVSHASPT